MIAALSALLLSAATLALLFIPLERAFPARPDQGVLRPGLRLDLTFLSGQYLLWNGLAIVCLGTVQRSLLAQGWTLRGLTDGLPPAALAALAIAGGDLLVYGFHRACHAWGPLWRFHAVHHSAEHLDWVAAHREHPLDGLLTQLCQNLPAMLLGLQVSTLSALIVFRSVWAVVVHANVRLPLGPLRWVLGAPELHHWHHAAVAPTRHNFANLAPWVDLLFGTHHLPAPDARYPLGLTEPGARGYLGWLLHPFRRAEAVLPSAAALVAAPAAHHLDGDRSHARVEHVDLAGGAA